MSATGDLANWAIPGGRTLGVGGAMDLAAGAGRVVVLTRHTTKTGAPKLVDRLTYPATASGVVSRVITDLGVFDVVDGAFRAVELAPGVTVDEVRGKTGARVMVARPP